MKPLEDFEVVLPSNPKDILCIQETNFKDNYHYSLRGY